jgi:hypothetical protein
VGFSAADYLKTFANGSEKFDHTFHVWLADRASGPIWGLMDEEFEHWSTYTGEHVAFFVDPFQRREWSLNFLHQLGLPPGLCDDLLRGLPQVQGLYRERLAYSLSRHLRLGVEYLPAAIVTTSWDAYDALVCYLRGADDVAALFRELVSISSTARPAELGRKRQGHRERHEPVKLNRLLERLRPNFDVQVCPIRTPISGAVEDALELTSRGLLSGAAASKMRNKHITTGFSYTRVMVAFNALDDLLLRAEKLDDLRRVPVARRKFVNIWKNEDEVRRQWSSVLELGQELDRASRAFRNARQEGHEPELTSAMASLLEQSRQFDLSSHLIATLGPRTYESLSDASRHAVEASELVYLLSQLIPGLQRDLSSAILGYWKAAEREGRRVLLELLARSFEVEFKDGMNWVRVQSEEQVGKYTMGSLRKVFHHLAIKPPDAAPNLPSRAVSSLLESVTFGERNAAIHDAVMRAEQLNVARERMGCNNPDGVLPLLVRCLEAIDPALLQPSADGDERFLRDREAGDRPLTQTPLGDVPAGADGKSPDAVAPASRLPRGTEAVWVVTGDKSRKGKPVFRLSAAQIEGVLHPRSLIPPVMKPGRAYWMRVVHQGARYQLEWLHERPSVPRKLNYLDQ